jgi:hypothetical protein
MSFYKFGTAATLAMLMPLAACTTATVPPNVAAAQIEASPAQAAATEPGSDRQVLDKSSAERKICRKLENTNTRLRSKKVCMTREAWKNYKS